MMQNQFMSPHLHRNTSFLNSCYMEVENFCISIELPHFHGPIQQQTTFTHIELNHCFVSATQVQMIFAHILHRTRCICYIEWHHSCASTTQSQNISTHSQHRIRSFLHINYMELDYSCTSTTQNQIMSCEFTTEKQIPIADIQHN